MIGDSQPEGIEQKLDRWLARCVDVGLVTLVFAVPLLLGGRTALGQLVLAIVSVGIAAAWSLRGVLGTQTGWARCGGLLLLAAALVLAVVQLAPLPAAVLDKLSPRLYETLSMWSPDAKSPLGVWDTLSLAPWLTRRALVLLSSFVLLFVVTVQRVRSVRDVEWLLRWIALAVLFMAPLALVHYFTTNGKYFWVYEHPFARPDAALAGSFTNRNHFAHFVAVGLGPMLWWFYHGAWNGRPHRRVSFCRADTGPDGSLVLRGAAVGLAVFAGLLSLSRGGAVTILTAAALSFFILYRRRLVGAATVGYVLVAALFVVACLGIYGYDQLAARLDDFRSISDLDRHQGRRTVWRAGVEAFRRFPIIGTGLGTHVEVSPVYLPFGGPFSKLEATHAESGYVQIAVEAGAVGLALVFGAGALCASWCVGAYRRSTSQRVSACVAAVAPALAASFIHSAVDFVWYVPGCMVAVVILAACASRLWQWTREGPGARDPCRSLSRSTWLVVIGSLLLAAGLMIPNRLAACLAEPHWHRYLKLSKALAGAEPEDRYQLLAEMAETLAQVVKSQPGHGRAHARLASVHIQLFDCPRSGEIQPFDVEQVRQTVEASHFRSAAELNDWLRRAFGHRRKHLYAAWYHARHALRLCPLQGEVYLYVGQLSFLRGPGAISSEALLQQALAVRPSNGWVLLAAGKDAILRGDFDRAVSFWKQALRASEDTAQEVLSLLAGKVPIQFLLDTFSLGEADLLRLLAMMERQQDEQGVAAVRKRLAGLWEQKAQQSPAHEAAGLWLQAAEMYRRLEQREERLRCLRQALDADPAGYDVRMALGRCLYETGSYAEAEQHLRWCLRLRPDDASLRRLVETAADRRLRMGQRPDASLR
ncbi:MAG TPA: tetratricopeptide repeat protein [Planctomycetes bacterium]|nr:tetratricopeptide repeat protein [Planctomycetota bacterium]